MIGNPCTHQYVDRQTGTVRTERLFGDQWVRLLYNPVRERSPYLFRIFTSRRMSAALGWWCFDRPLPRSQRGLPLLQRFGVDPAECCLPPAAYTGYRAVFERQIRFWDCRPLPDQPQAIVAPADARMLIGSLTLTSSLFIKEKLFGIDELLGHNETLLDRFGSGDYAVFRLTPEKYHYTHVPAGGRITDLFTVDGRYHCCNPAATVAIAEPLSKNRRMVTVIDTDVPGGTGVGRVAMIEIVALMIGDIRQCYSDHRYDRPSVPVIGQMVRLGAVKGLFCPGSSTIVLLFEPGRLDFCRDLQRNSRRCDVNSRFSVGFHQALVETEVAVRSVIGTAIHQKNGG